MIRHPDWQSRLVLYLTRTAAKPFVPGRQDCALFAAGAIEAMTGVDPADGWRGRYRSLRGGQRMLRAAGYGDHVALAAAILPEVTVAEAAPGDIAVIETPEGRALGVVQGAGIYVTGALGLGLMPLRDAVRAFRVG